MLINAEEGIEERRVGLVDPLNFSFLEKSLLRSVSMDL